MQLGDRALDRDLWQRSAAHLRRARSKASPDAEFTKTFFSSITRRLFGTVGVAPEIEFVATELDPLASIHSSVLTASYTNRGSLALLVEDLLGDLPLPLALARLRQAACSTWSPRSARTCRVPASGAASSRIEIIRPVFYQVTRAYVVGRITGRDFVPCRWCSP